MKIGFIGLGVMGKPMAANLVRGGHILTVFSRRREPADSLAAIGATPAASPREVAAASSLVVTMVSDTRDVDSVLFGHNGVSRGLKPGSTVIDMSTISPVAAAEFAARIEAQGSRMLDAPVSGGEKGAIEGTLTIMVGGDRAVYGQFLPVLQLMGKTIAYTGGSGNGQKTKMVNQVIVALNLLGMVEGLRLATAGGLDPETTLRLVSGGAAGSWMVANLGPKVLAGDFAPGFRIELQQKDLRLATEWIRQLGIECPGTELTYALFSKALEQGLGAQSTHGLINLWAERPASAREH